MFWFFGLEACGILAPGPGMEPTPPELKGRVLTTGPPGKSLSAVPQLSLLSILTNSVPSPKLFFFSPCGFMYPI